ncbi:MAG: MarR family transcriptional regulator [Myxococcales bacterium]|nr:MarR family transcriptional regulator [Myxococcales bacterium]
MSDDALRLDQQLCFALYSASRAMIRAYQPLLEPLGITYPQYLVMLALWERDGVTVKSLGERLALDSGTLTPLLQRLEAQGVVRRQRSDEDERKVEIHLTSAGRQMRNKARSIPTALACRAGFDVEDKDALRKLGQLRETLRALEQTIERDREAIAEPAAATATAAPRAAKKRAAR